MHHTEFLFPEILQDTPRLFTAIAEWLAVFVFFLICRRKVQKLPFVLYCMATFLLMAVCQYVAGRLTIVFWIPTMILAVVIMNLSLRLVLDIHLAESLVLTTHAFVLAEFAASLYRQLYVWLVYITGKDSFITSVLIMLVVYSLVFYTYYRLCRQDIQAQATKNLHRKEVTSIVITGIVAFLMGNISFINISTPFTATGSILYVRTLVDFGGLLMLITQAERKNELNMKEESYEINQLFTKQYEQYRLAVDNSELLRREIHDMKHYVAALKVENDPQKRAEILEDMEQSMAIQQSFMDTGNKVLDVILTTKSLQCEQEEITLNCMTDGEALSAIHAKDICSLFGNILDNAIEATRQVADTEKRLINLTAKKKNQFIIIECENYSTTPSLSKDDALPATTKQDHTHHGYGLKSIRTVAEKYGGATHISSKDGWFKIKVLLLSSE